MPRAQNLQQQRFKGVAHLVELVDQQHAGSVAVSQRPQEWTFGKKINRMQALSNGVPIFAEAVALGFEEKLLQGLVELADGLVFRDAFVALKALDERSRSLGHGVCELRLATAGRPFHQQRLLHAGGEINHFQGHLVDDVSGFSQPRREFLP